jgi:hypothetical protein
LLDLFSPIVPIRNISLVEKRIKRSVVNHLFNFRGCRLPVTFGVAQEEPGRLSSFCAGIDARFRVQQQAAEGTRHTHA